MGGKVFEVGKKPSDVGDEKNVDIANQFILSFNRIIGRDLPS